MSISSFFKFYISVVNFERVYATQGDAYEAAELEWMLANGRRRYKHWESFRGAVCRILDPKIFFFTVAVHLPGCPPFVATFLTQADCRKFIKSLSERTSATFSIYRTNDGRIRTSDTPVETID